MAIHEDGSSRKRRRNGDDNNNNGSDEVGTDDDDDDDDDDDSKNNNSSDKCCKKKSRTEVAATTTNLVQKKEKILQLSSSSSSSSSSVPTSSQISKAMKLMGPSREGDTTLGSIDEIKLDNQIFWWDDKYNRRKPKYFSRVHIGYEWNRYNRDVYNKTDQKPPKVVQGYKFNIFYPELICKSRSPTYLIVQDGSRDGETCAIRFSAGPPYEDIAFRIINREWERSYKRGFKCSFEHGFFQLYFNFRRFPAYQRYYS